MTVDDAADPGPLFYCRGCDRPVHAEASGGVCPLHPDQGPVHDLFERLKAQMMAHCDPAVRRLALWHQGRDAKRRGEPR